MLKKNAVLLAAFVLALFSLTLAQDESGKGGVKLPDGLELRPHAYGHLEVGQIGQGTYDPSRYSRNGNSYKIDHVWTENAYAAVGFEALYRERLKMVVELGTKLYFSYPVLFDQRYTKNLRQDVGLGDVYAQYSFGDVEMPWLLGQVGYFNFKYNPDVRNLGEYMFRSGTYPAFLDMSFDFPSSRLLGLHVQSNLFKSLKLDVLFTSATIFPAMNWSLAALANYDVAALHFIDIGAGVDFAHLLSVYNDHTFPSLGGDLTTPKSTSVNNQYILNGDTAFYTFQGIKAMGRISIDPKAFIKSKILGENDLKLYAEACIIGAKNYPDSGILMGGSYTLVAPSYNNLLEKTPIAVGFNFPAFKLLDVLNVEVEYFGSKYLNDAAQMINLGSQPQPSLIIFQDTTTGIVESKYKWSVYVKKSLFNGHFAITGQIGRDHMRLPCASYNDEMWNELLVEEKDWWWVLKTSWMF
jgi:hypothetical protein